jgi:2-succinyl-6-hydroxy-2,4-cyclohexadiene-1-carboxylate synthase
MSSSALTELAPGIAARSRRGPLDRILWIHGYAMDSSIWTPLWDRLPGWHHIGVDLPGHGASPPPEAGLTGTSLARRLGEVAVEHGVAHVVGLSFGGTVALQVAIERPRAFRTLVLGAPGLGGGPQDRHAQARNLELGGLYRERGSGPWMAELWMQPSSPIFAGAARRPELWSQLRGLAERHAWTELADGSLHALVTHPQSPSELGRIGAATLVIVGQEDMPAFKRAAELIRRAIPQSRRFYLPGTGHLPLLEEPGGIAPLLDAHFSGGRSDPAARGRGEAIATMVSTPGHARVGG